MRNFGINISYIFDYPKSTNTWIDNINEGLDGV